MQYVGQTFFFFFFKNGFTEDYRRIKKPQKIDIFLNRHFKFTNNSPNHISIQPVEKIDDGNSTKRYGNILRHELELK